MDLLQCSLEFETFPSLFNTQYDFDSRANDTLTQEKYHSDVFTIFLTVMNVFKWHKHTRSCCWSPLASVSLSLEYTFTHKYRECVSGVCFCSCVRWLKKRRAKAVCVCVCVCHAEGDPSCCSVSLVINGKHSIGRSVFLAVSCLRASVKTGLCPTWPRRLLRSLLVEKQEKEIPTEHRVNEL